MRKEKKGGRNDGAEQMTVVQEAPETLLPFLFGPQCRLGLEWSRQQSQPEPASVGKDEAAVCEHRGNRFPSRTQANQPALQGHRTVSLHRVPKEKHLLLTPGLRFLCVSYSPRFTRRVS